MPIAAGLAEDSIEVQQWRTEFSSSRYGVIRQAISPDAASIATQYLRILHDHYEPLLFFDARQKSYGRYNDPLGESVLAMVAPQIARLTGLALLPTYSFLRMYKSGGVLRKHVDRPSCEVSATLFLGSDAVWPISVEVDGTARQVHLEPGDLMLYRGCDVPHWRDPFPGQYSVHAFLHFVEAGGPHAHLIYDERTGLGAPQRKSAPQRDRPEATHPESGRQRNPDPPGVRRNAPCPCGSGK
jgi:hypothetical protein